MKKTNLFLIFFLFVFLFSFSACTSKKEKDVDIQIEGIEAGIDNSDFSGSVLDIFAKKKPLKCEVEIDNLEGSVKMTYYFDNNGEKFRAESEIINKSSGESFLSVGIFKDDWYYFWDDITNTDGMKTKILEEDNYHENEGDYSSIDIEEEFNFNCVDWKVDTSLFDLPADKSFKDLTEIFTDLDFINTPNDVNGVDTCSYCEMIPDGPEREECLLSC